jgi:hypothetical protein
MKSIRKRFATLIFISLISAAAVVSCGKQKDHPAGEHPSDSTEHPSDSTKQGDSTEHPNEHPQDSTKN